MPEQGHLVVEAGQLGHGRHRRGHVLAEIGIGWPHAVRNSHQGVSRHQDPGGFVEDAAPLDGSIDCPASRDYAKAYLHHLFKAGELLGQTLLSWHNLAYYQSLMARLRAAIADGCLQEFRETFRERAVQ